MNPDSPKNPRAELEAQLTALILGELPAEQAFALGRALEQDAELAKLYERLKQTIQLVRETEARPTEQTAAQPAPLKLSDERRQKLLQQFKTVVPKEFEEQSRKGVRLLEIAAALAIIAVLAGLLLPSLARSKSKGSVRTASDQTVALLAADTALERAKVEMLGKIAAFEDSRQKVAQVVEDLSPNAPASTAPPSPSAKPVLNSIVLPSVGEDGSAPSATVTTTFPQQHGLALPGPLSPSDPSVLNSDEIKPGFGSNLGKQNGAENSSLAGDAEWIGQLERPGLDRPHSNTNGFISRYAYIPAPNGKTLDRAMVTNYAINAESQARANLLYDPRPPVFGNTTHEDAGNLRYYQDLNRNQTALSATTLSGYGDTSAQWNLGSGNGAFDPASGLPGAAAGRAGVTGGGGAGGGATAAPGARPDTQTRQELVESRIVDVPESLGGNKGIEWSDATKQSAASAAPEGNKNRGFADAGKKDEKTLGLNWNWATPKALVPPQQDALRKPGESTLARRGVNTVNAEKVDGLALGELNAKNPELTVDSLNRGLAEDELRRNGGATNGYNLNVVGYLGMPSQSNFGTIALNGTTSVAGHTLYRLRSQLGTDFSEAQATAPIHSAQPSAIVLPSLQAESSVAGGEKIGKDVSRSLATDKPSAGVRIPDMLADSDGPATLMSAETLRRIEGSRIESKAELTRQETLLKQLKELEPEALVQTLPTAAQDDVLSSLLKQRTLADQRLLTLKKDPEPESAELQSATSSVADIRDKITKRVDGILLGLDAKVASLREGVDSLEKEVAGASATDLEKARQNRPYFDAKRVLKDAPKKESDISPPKPAAPALLPQPEVSTHDNPFSTFSLNVSDVSFKLAGASLEKGVMPEPASVRSEEFINAFDYRDPEAPPGVPVAFAWERANYPFAQNRDLLRFSIKTAAQGRQPGRPLNIVLLLDNSGSMERADRVRIIHEALRVLASQLQAQDMLSVVTFSRTARLRVDGVSGDQAGQVAEDLGKLTPEGGTNLEEAMNLAYQTALRHYLANGINRVVLLTDGAANLGNVEPEALKQKVEAQRKQGIALDCFGIGWEGFNDDLLEVLSRNGDGRYGFINTPEEAASEFAGQLAGALHVAASDVKVQVEFNPARVTNYRQIGYAKHQLTKEQFRDNTVDAAEIGAAESGNALYTVEVNPRGEGPLAIVRVRYKVPGTAEYHEHEWAVPYTGNAVSLEQANPAMRLAATASAFSEWLVSSPYAGEVTPDRLLGYLSGVPEVYGADARPKKLEWMIRQAKSIAGK